MHRALNHKLLFAALTLLLLAEGFTSAYAEKMRLAEAGPADIKKLIDLVAFEHAKARGVDYEVKYFKSDDIASQAIMSGQVDIVISSLGYSAMQAVNAPYRHIMQLRPLMYYPIVAIDFAKSWKDMNGKDFVVHARASGTEVIAREIEAANGIKFSRMSYIPGSQIRANSLLNGTIKATMLDIQGMQYVLRKSPEKFVVLPVPHIPVSEAALYASTDFLAKNRGQVQILVEELLKAFRASASDTKFVASERTRLNLLPDLAPDLVAEIEPFYLTAAKQGLYPLDGGGEAAAKADLDFYGRIGVLKGDAASLKVEDYWDLSMLSAALRKVGPANAPVKAGQ
jgi:NitT/TauT family transport system substrate-binding protein